MNIRFRGYLVMAALAAVFVTGNARSSQGGPVAPLANFSLVASYPSLGLLPGGGGNPANFSDIAYNYDTSTLFIIDNGNQDVYEYSTTGTPLRRIVGSGQLDTEGIAYMGSSKFAIIEEGVKDISIVNIGPSTTSFSKGGALQVIVPSAPAGNLANTGFEGITYDSKNNQFYVVKEKSSRQVYQVANSGTSTLLSTVTTAVTGTGVTDLSGVYFDNSPGGHLYILSDESNRVVEVGLDGTVHAQLTVAGTQPEGITFTPDGLNMFILGEQRELYHYQASPVPEPGTLTLAGIGCAIGFIAAWRRRWHA